MILNIYEAVTMNYRKKLKIFKWDYNLTIFSINSWE